MHVEDIKRWHWALIAVVVGLLLSWVWSSVEWDENLPTIGQREFEAGLLIPKDSVGTLLNVTVMPKTESGIYKIVAEQVRPGKTQGKGETKPVAFVAETPYKAGVWRNDTESFPTVLEYLKQLKTQNPDVAYRYAWYREKWAVYTLWTGAAVLLIGGVWPSVVSLMVGAGLGFNREEKGPEYDLNRFKSEVDAKKAAGAEPTAADMVRLRQLEEELERKLAAQRAGLPMPEDEPVVAAAVKKLEGGTLEAANLNKPPEEHEYKGEFYPVDRHINKKDK